MTSKFASRAALPILAVLLIAIIGAIDDDAIGTA